MATQHGHTVVSFLGPKLDRSGRGDRWDSWRPNVAMCQHEDLLVSRLVLITERQFGKLYNQIAGDIALVSPETAVERYPISLRDPWDFEEVFDQLLSIADDLALDPEENDVLVHMTTGTHVAQICLFLLTEARHFPARLLQTGPPTTAGTFRPGRTRGGARGRSGSDGGEGDGELGRSCPIGTWQIIDLDLSRFDRLAQRFAQEHAQGESLLKSGIQTENGAFNALISQVERVAPLSTAPMLLMGPTGAGKSHLAKQIYELKKQRRQLHGPFVEVNCATIRGDGAHSTLFGHTKGAFTGATNARPGLLRAADRGLLFLDEIGELGLDEQAMLLRALEEKRFLPLGADAEVESDFQLIAGTNRDLGQSVAAGTFREDLLARINLWTYHLPGLKDRIEDLEPNVDYELTRYSAAFGRRVHFAAEARRRYLEFATSPAGLWLGNFRDLNASLTRLCTLAHGGRITDDEVGAEIARLERDWQRGAPGDPRAQMQRDDDALLGEVLGDAQLDELDRFDRVQLAEVIRTCQRHRSLSAAGRELFAASRRRKASSNDTDRLRKYLARYGVEFAALRSTG